MDSRIELGLELSFIILKLFINIYFGLVKKKSHILTRDEGGDND